MREGNVPVTTTVRSAIGDVVKTLAYKALEVDAEIPGIKNVGTCVESERDVNEIERSEEIGSVYVQQVNSPSSS